MREEEKNRTSQNSKIQQFFRKRWVFPAIYLVSAALILTSVLMYQASRNDLNPIAEQPGKPQTEKGQDAEEVAKQVETVTAPALEKENIQVIKNFYDAKASKEEQEAALVSYNNTYRPNQGIDLAQKDGKEFDVAASLSGTVLRAEKDSILGYVVEIQHEDNVTTIYQSLASVAVEEGETVAQNAVIGKAGKNLLNEKNGVHVHFEIRKDGKALNPASLLDKPATAIEDEAAASKETEAKPQEEMKEEKQEDKKDSEAAVPSKNA
ncbi:peptidoglycan DD-metalloendopeptidase family protein [Bacillus mangrovi]|uniref:Peptidoglycan DD-metalloendopeptidase family protein n=1 Tax=Metabacillus mangrovi TaxID=1491830 RepID=A0A7X2S5B5_9BACI|nr:M23 family metallopeptidase [Metabacillus mangrovi]MTH53988.1 peptidoglycan DD-metalloendopeptidase family protein [Metabacillus mangrovi]